jgi:hypothetical protein
MESLPMKMYSEPHSPLNCTGFQDLFETVSSKISGVEHAVVGIDGAMSIGKSPMARQLGQAIGAEVVELDVFHSHDGAPYVEKIDTDRLRRTLTRALESGPPVVIEGVCLLDVLRRINIDPTVLVFIKPGQRSIAGDFIDPDLTEDDMLRNIGTGKLAALDREIGLYQRRARPHERADVLFESPPTPNN